MRSCLEGNLAERRTIMWRCQAHNCGYTYDPVKGDKRGKIPPGVAFEDLPEDWKCPCCGASKKMFKKLDG